MDTSKPFGEVCTANGGLKKAHDIELFNDLDDDCAMTNSKSAGVMTPPMVGSTWPRVRLTLGSDCLPALSQGTASFYLSLRTY